MLLLNLASSKHLLVWFFPWESLGFSFVSFSQGYFSSLLGSLFLLPLVVKKIFHLPKLGPWANSPHGNETLGFSGFLPSNGGYWLWLCTSLGSLIPSPTEVGKMAVGSPNPNSRQSELLPENDLSAGVWERTSLRETCRPFESTGVPECYCA